MTSFIEIPLLAEGGDELSSIYINVGDIISLQADGADTRVEIRDYGGEAATRTCTSYLPIGMLLDTLRQAVRWSGVYSWNDGTKHAFGEPARARARAAADAERLRRLVDQDDDAVTLSNSEPS